MWCAFVAGHEGPDLLPVGIQDEVSERRAVDSVIRMPKSVLCGEADSDYLDQLRGKALLRPEDPVYSEIAQAPVPFLAVAVVDVGVQKRELVVRLVEMVGEAGGVAVRLEDVSLVQDELSQLLVGNHGMHDAGAVAVELEEIVGIDRAVLHIAVGVEILDLEVVRDVEPARIDLDVRTAVLL